MGKMKKGTFVTLDKNYGNICVGDHVKDADGNIYKIDSNGHAVSKKDKSVHTIKSIKEPTYYAIHEDKEPKEKAASVEAPAEAADTSLADSAIRFAKRNRNKAVTPRKRKQPRSKGSASAQVTLAEATDQMLADELRRRGYKLTAKKTVNIKL